MRSFSQLSIKSDNAQTYGDLFGPNRTEKRSESKMNKKEQRSRYSYDWREEKKTWRRWGGHLPHNIFKKKKRIKSPSYCTFGCSYWLLPAAC